MEKIIEEAIKEILMEQGVELISVSLGEEDGNKTLFITIDSKDGVDTNLCTEVTKIISPIIDNLDLNLEDYILDVGSKGIEE